MNVQFETPNTPTEGILRISVEQADLQPRIDKKIKEMGHKISLKGFRPGKVPPQLAKRMMEKDLIPQELNGFLNDTIYEYFEGNDEVTLLGSPTPIIEEEVVDFKRGGTFKFAFKCGIVPSFTYDLSQLYVQDYEVMVSDSTIEKVITDLQRSHGKHGEAEFTSKEDVLKGVLYDTQHDYSLEENHPSEEDINGEGDSSKIYLETYLPISAIHESELHNFIDVPTGTIVHFDIQKVMQDSEKGLHLLTGKSKEDMDKLEGEFAFEIKEIMHTAMAELNQDFFDKVFPKLNITNEEDFLVAIKEDTQNYYIGKNTELKKDQIRKQLIENTTMELPHEILKSSLEKRGTQEDGENFEDDYAKMENSIRWEVLLNRVNDQKFNFVIEEEAVMQMGARSLMDMYGQYGQSQEIFNYVLKIAKEYTEKNYRALEQGVLSERVLQALSQEIVGPKQVVSEDEFMAIYNAL